VPHAPVYFPADFSTQQKIDAVQAYLQELQYLFIAASVVCNLMFLLICNKNAFII